MSTSWSGLRQSLPRSTKLRILRRDGGVCQICGGARCQNRALEIDHRTPVAEGGSDHDDNLWAIGADPCHAEKTATEQARGRTRRQRNATRPAERHPGLR
jgi:5-methylcytosine-specific restriction enzyme A